MWLFLGLGRQKVPVETSPIKHSDAVMAGAVTMAVRNTTATCPHCCPRTPQTYIATR